MSNIVSIAKRSVRSETLLGAAVDPVTFSTPGVCIDAIVETITILERGEGRENARLPELVTVVKQLTSQLKKASISHGFTKKELIIWVALEVMETGVGVENLMEWMNHRSTLDEVIFHGDQSIATLLKKDTAASARERYKTLQASHLG